MKGLQGKKAPNIFLLLFPLALQISVWLWSEKWDELSLKDKSRLYLFMLQKSEKVSVSPILGKTEQVYLSYHLPEADLVKRLLL